MKRLLRYPVVVAMLAVIAVGAGTLDYFVPSMGDDLIFWSQLGLDSYTHPDRNTVSFILAHIMGCNGRLFDYMGPVVIDLLPRAVASAVMGVMTGLFFFSVIYSCRLPRQRYQTLSLIVMGITLAAMPWWDSMYLHVCQFNYLWTTTFCLLFIGIFNRDVASSSRIRSVMVFFLGILAGGSHEQAGIAMCMAFGVWLVAGSHYRRLSAERRYMLAGLLAGTLMSLLSPGIWHRAVQGGVGQTPCELLLSTLPLLSLLLIVIAACAMTTSTRRYLRGLADGEWGVTVGLAVFSAIIVMYSRIPGRTGFLPEAAAIVALTRMALDIRCRISRPVAATVAVAILVLVSVHFAVSIQQQRRLMHEFEDVKAAYIESADGVVYYDFTNRYDVSPLTLYRVKGVADADDYWLLYAMQQAYGDSAKVPVVLPASMEGCLESLTDSLNEGSVTVYTSKPAHTVVTLDDAVLQYYPGPSPRVVTSTRLADGREIWVATPRVRDPGDD